MTQEDFDDLAALVAQRQQFAHRLQDPTLDAEARRWCADLVKFCQARDPQFDEAKFVAACGF